MGTIYGLYCICHPKEIRYVGQTSRSMKERFRSYKTACAQNKPWPVIHWMRKHGVGNIRWDVLETPENDLLNEREIWWINELDTFKGRRGLNATEGGGGLRGWKISPEQSSALSARTRGENHHFWGKQLSDEHRARLSQSLRGRKISKAHREKLRQVWTGRKHKDESRAKMSKAKKEFMSNPENREHLSRYRKGNPRFSGENAGGAKLTAEQVAEIRTLFSTGDFSKAELGRRFGVRPTSIANIINGKTWNG